jgi:hypothetical protein
MDYIQIGFDNALTAEYTAEQIRAMKFDDIHTLCKKNKDSADDIFVWESVREAIAGMIENYVPDIEIEAENGAIVTEKFERNEVGKHV